MQRLMQLPSPCIQSDAHCWFDSNGDAVTEGITGEEGLSAYAMDTIPEDLLQQAESGPGTGSEGTNRAWVSLNNPNPTVVENLQGLARVVASRHLPRVQGWLKVLVKVSVRPDCKTPSPQPHLTNPFVPVYLVKRNTFLLIILHTRAVPGVIVTGLLQGGLDCLSHSHAGFRPALLEKHLTCALVHA